ncbi:hypothetical protein HDV63DRAFT_415107 [Trichoderma sp. SZMC 28014]
MLLVSIDHWLSDTEDRLSDTEDRLSDTEDPLVFKCLDCPQSFKTAGRLLKHCRQQHGSEGLVDSESQGLDDIAEDYWNNKCKCPDCGQEFGSHARRDAHIASGIHTDSPKFQYSECQKVFDAVDKFVIALSGLASAIFAERPATSRKNAIRLRGTLKFALAGLRQDKEKNTSKIVSNKALPRSANMAVRRYNGPGEGSSNALTFGGGSRTKDRRYKEQYKQCTTTHGGHILHVNYPIDTCLGSRR